MYHLYIGGTLRPLMASCGSVVHAPTALSLDRFGDGRLNRELVDAVLFKLEAGSRSVFCFVYGSL